MRKSRLNRSMDRRLGELGFKFSGGARGNAMYTRDKGNIGGDYRKMAKEGSSVQYVSVSPSGKIRYKNVKSTGGSGRKINTKSI